jgi:hypothetical protein
MREKSVILNPPPPSYLTMKTAVFATLFASAAAFAPASQRATVQTSHAMSAELEGMLGADVETGGRIVSTSW